MFMHGVESPSSALLGATTYRYRVYAINEASDGSNGATPTTYSPDSDDIPDKTHASMKPVAPAMLSAEQAKDSNFVSNQDRGVLIMWTGPADPDGAKVSGYEIQRKVNDGEFLLLGEWSNRTTHYTDTAPPGTDEVRMYQVRARNKLGWSPWSASITSPLGEPVEPPPALANPALTATPGTGSVTLMWVEQAAAVEYTVWGVRHDGSAVRVGSTDALIRVNDVVATSYTVMDLMSGEEYWFAVTACEMVDCGAGNYLHSNVVVATPD